MLKSTTPRKIARSRMVSARSDAQSIEASNTLLRCLSSNVEIYDKRALFSFEGTGIPFGVRSTVL